MEKRADHSSCVRTLLQQKLHHLPLPAPGSVHEGCDTRLGRPARDGARDGLGVEWERFEELNPNMSGQVSLILASSHPPSVLFVQP